MHPMLNIAVKAARRAATIIQRAAANLDIIKVEMKHHNDFVSEVDRAAEAAIIEVISEAYPQHTILAEESGHHQASHASDDYLWIIDPLDGTTNFLHGFPHYCVAIGLQHRGQMTQAVVYDPAHNDLFTATRGSGAFLNDRRIRVSKKRDLSKALLNVSVPCRDVEHLEQHWSILKKLIQNTSAVRHCGAAALDLAYVACGRCDGFWELGLSPWDIAAGSLLVQEAGGLVTDRHGGAAYLQRGDIVAATPKLLAPLLALLAQESEQG